MLCVCLCEFKYESESKYLSKVHALTFIYIQGEHVHSVGSRQVDLAIYH